MPAVSGLFPPLGGLHWFSFVFLSGSNILDTESIPETPELSLSLSLQNAFTGNGIPFTDKRPLVAYDKLLSTSNFRGLGPSVVAPFMIEYAVLIFVSGMAS